MAVASAQGFVGGTNASPSVALHPQGLTDRGGGCPSLATAHTLTADSAGCFKISSPASAITQALPTTNVKAGRRFTMIVTGATETNYVALQSSGGNEIDRIGGDGVIEVVSLQDAPTTAAHWAITNLWEKTGLIATTPTGANTNDMSISLVRDRISVTLEFSQVGMAAAGGSSINTPNGAIPIRFIPSITQYSGSVSLDDSKLINSCVSVTSAGAIIVNKEALSAFAGTCSASPDSSAVTYRL